MIDKIVSNGNYITWHRHFAYNGSGPFTAETLPCYMTYGFTYDIYGILTPANNRMTGSQAQTFSYDNVDRLTGVSVGNNNRLTVSYAANGNISTKTDMGLYSYNSNSKPHAVDYILPPDNRPESEQYIEYNDWGKATDVYYYVGDDFYHLEMDYGPDRQHVSDRLLRNDTILYYRFFWDEYERNSFDGNNLTYYWVEAPDGLAGMFGLEYGHYNDGAIPFVAITDHLGSLTALYNRDGYQTLGLAYDAWGRRTFTMNSMTQIKRGFTGHGHIDELGLINMGGRVYDPLQGRFLSPDNYIQSPDNPQNYNRYSYCLNNPLKYTDPSGEKISWLWGLAVALNIIPVESAIAYTTVATTDAVTSGTIGFLDGGIDEAANRAANSIKIATGLLESDCLDGNELEQFSRSYFRSIWCSPASLFGYAYATNANYFDRVDVEKYYGATVVRTQLVDGGVTFGHYININSNIDDDFESMLIHEYGHFMQTRDWGGFSALSGGIFSLVSAMDIFPRNDKGHEDMWIEKDASIRGARHLKDEYDKIKTKYNEENPQRFYDLRMLHNMFIPFSVGYGIYNIFNPN